MEVIKEKILYILLICLMILIIGITILFIINKKSITDNNAKEIYGKWLIQSSQIIVNNEVKFTNEDFNGNYIVINKDNIDVCYYEDNNSKCKRWRRNSHSRRLLSSF